MFYRKLFITNSSSTSLVAFGIEVDRSVFDKIEEELPEGIREYYTPGDIVYVTIGFPKVYLDKEGLVVHGPATELQEKYKALEAWAKRNGVEDTIGYIEDGWYAG
jgi:hypothetical protein